MIQVHALSAAGESSAVWIDLRQPDAAELAQAERRAGFAIPDRARISEIEFTSRVRRVGETLFLNLPRFEEGKGRAAPLGFALSPTALVTRREQEIVAFDDIARDLGKRPCGGSADLFLRMLEHIVDCLADRLEAMEAAVSEATRESFEGSRRDRDLKQHLMHAGDLGRRLGRLHNTLLGLMRVVTWLQETPPPWFGPEAPRRISLIHKDLGSLNEFDQQLGDRLDFLLNGVLGLISTNQNEVMKVMAVASVVGVPPTVLVGVWGMNFAFMPELAWRPGYYLALAAIGLSIAVPLWWFRRRGWI
jgi:magnesium transporter